MRQRSTLRLCSVGVIVVAAVMLVSCGRSNPSGGGATMQSAPSPGLLSSATPSPSRDPQHTELWSRAENLEPDELARLADKEGTPGLLEGAQDPSLRPIAIRALAYASGFGALPWLADIAGRAKSLTAAPRSQPSWKSLRARVERLIPRTLSSSEEGCEKLLVMAKESGKPAKERIPAIRALRMLAEPWGPSCAVRPCCVKAADVPNDLDAR